MRLIYRWTTVAGLCALPAILHAQAASAPPSKKVVKKICRTEVPTGSIMMQTRCATAEQWAETDAANRRGAEHALGRDGVGLGGNAPEAGQ